jgi:putative endonuclease
MTSIGNRRRNSGQRGEKLAAWFLEQRGYQIRERNLRLGRFEIDLVVEKHGTLVFVEVKTRSGTAWERAGASLRAAQRQRLAAAASAYVSREVSRHRGFRFDVISIDEDEHSLVIEHHQDALGAEGELR